MSSNKRFVMKKTQRIHSTSSPESFSIRLPSYVYLYFFCQSINLMTAVISVAVAAVVGNKISSNPLYATVPYGVQFLFIFLGTYPASLLMKKYGRKVGFTTGAVFLLFAGLTGYFSIVESSFSLLVISHGFIGLFTACANFYRYAVTDGLPESLQPKALSLVVAGGIIAGILGPTMSSQLQDISGFPQFSLCYASLMVLAFINLAIIYFLPDANVTSFETEEDHKNNILKNRDIVFASICIAACGYGLMNLLMIQSSLKMDHMHIKFEDVAFAIQWHVVAMFFPSFFTGILISRLGHIAVIVSGFVLFIISFSINIYDISYNNIALSLILLGVGWNFTYVGGSSMLTSSLVNSSEKQRWQGVGDTAIAIFATIGAMSPSFLLNDIGWKGSNIISIVMCIVSLFGIMLLKIKHGHELK